MAKKAAALVTRIVSFRRTKERRNEAQFYVSMSRAILPSSLPTTVLSSLLRNLCLRWVPFFVNRSSHRLKA